MRTLEKISTRLPLQSPRFLLGLLRLLLADGRSQCCSRACRFWRIKPLAMAAAMVAREWVWRKKGTDGRGAGGTREGRGGAHRGYPSGRLRGKPGGVGERNRGAQSRLGPIALPEERGARRAKAPGARRGELENSRPCPLPLGRVGARSGLGAAGAQVTTRLRSSLGGLHRHSRCLLSLPAFLAGGRVGHLLPATGRRAGLCWVSGYLSVQGARGRTQHRAGTAP